VDDMTIPGREDHWLQELIGRYDAPAYVRRAREVQGAFDELVARCRRQREGWLDMVRLRLGTLRALAGGWEALRPLLAGDQVHLLDQLHESLRPRLRVPVEPTPSARALRRALAELTESIERFNRRWREFLRGVDVTPVNDLREGYNRYYVLEKECAVRSARVARHGFRRLEPLSVDELAALLPPLPVPRVQADDV
jgi:hypothetical protein